MEDSRNRPYEIPVICTSRDVAPLRLYNLFMQISSLFSQKPLRSSRSIDIKDVFFADDSMPGTARFAICRCRCGSGWLSDRRRPRGFRSWRVLQDARGFRRRRLKYWQSRRGAFFKALRIRRAPGPEVYFLETRRAGTPRPCRVGSGAADHGDRDFVRDQFTRIGIFLGGFPEVGVVFNMVTDMSPVETCATWRKILEQNRWVPFPAPGGPNKTTFFPIILPASPL